MRHFLRLFFSSEGQGNIGYDFPAANAANVLDAANDGLSTDAATAKIAQLGQTVGRAGNPAQLLENREIPLAAFGILLSGMAAANPAITIKEVAAASRKNNSQILFLDSAGVECGRITMGGSFGQYILLGQGCGALADATTAGNGIIALGDFACRQIVTGQTIIAIGSGALQGTGALVQPSNVIAIGNDVLDRNAAAIADAVLCIGNNSMAGGAGKTIGTRLLVIGHASGGPGANADTVGDDVIVIGHGSNPGGGLTDTTIIGNLQNGINFFTLSHVILLGKSTQNTLIGQVVAAWSDNGNRLQVNGSGFFAGGLRPKIRTTTTLAETFGALDYTVLADTTAGNMNFSVNPATLNQAIGNIKKLSADANTVTITPTSGTIQGIGAPAATFVFNAQGQSVTFQSDGTNLYIL
jgi:Cu/Ag efflux protein CusF